MRYRGKGGVSQRQTLYTNLALNIRVGFGPFLQWKYVFFGDAPWLCLATGPVGHVSAEQAIVHKNTCTKTSIAFTRRKVMFRIHARS